MTRPVPFSLEYTGFIGYEKLTLKQLLEEYAYMDGLGEYLYDIHHGHKDVPAYHDLVAFRRDIDRVHDVRTDRGEAFLDGGALALDSIDIFVPNLMEPVHDELVKTRLALDPWLHGDNPSRQEELMYIENLAHVGSSLTSHYMHNYQKIMGSIADLRGYKRVEQHLSIVHGFTLVMDAAARAYETDLAKFEEEVIDEIVDNQEVLFSDISKAMKAARGRSVS